MAVLNDFPDPNPPFGCDPAALNGCNEIFAQESITGPHFFFGGKNLIDDMFQADLCKVTNVPLHP